MKSSSIMLATLLASGVAMPAMAQTAAQATTVAAAAAAASSGAPAAPSPANAQLANLAAQDFGRLSVDGNTAFEELSLARQAIYDGDLDTAKKLIASAQTALETAKADNTAFQKAEDELMPTKTRQQPPRPLASTGKQVAWLPIDGELVLDETVEPTPEKSAALAAANRHLKAGNTARASEVLRVSSVDADYIIAAVPLEQTRNDVAQAAKFIKSNPYKASEALRDAENAVRYASVDIQGAGQQSAGAPTAPSK
ncbi:YfdX family protein [Acetobacter senegalensis]|uniref:YfdX family protein n=1 Tax=Acetobacter senegalensis TaxID=446692 RepID=UPI00264D2B9F|nr:YfdX family protein [Acetobacter senegalensis]MDN7352818.1 YfdX family protein [Acetobacter senegalensis]